MTVSRWEEISTQIDAPGALAVKVTILLATVITGYQFPENKLRH